MRVVLDTNILISALIVPGGVPDRVYQAWRSGQFTLVSSDEQLEEFRRVTHYPRVRRYLAPAPAGAMMNELKQLAMLTKSRPVIDAASDPADNFLLAMAVQGDADYLVTGDRHSLLSLGRYGLTQIVSARHFAEVVLGKRSGG